MTALVCARRVSVVCRHRLGHREHVVHTSDVTGKFTDERTVKHAGEEARAVRGLAHGDDRGGLDQVAVAIEIPRARSSVFLVERGAAVFAVNPRTTRSVPGSVQVAGAKVIAGCAGAPQRGANRWGALPRLAVDEPLVRFACASNGSGERGVLQQEVAGAGESAGSWCTDRPEWLTLSQCG